MVALVDAKEVTGGGLFGRLGRRLFGVRGVGAVYQEILGMETLLVTLKTDCGLTPREIEKQVFAAAEIMRYAGCEKICFSKIFPYRDEFLRESFVEIEDTILYERLAGPIAMRFAGKDKTAALFAKRLTLDSERTLISLCGGFRYVMAEIETGGERIIDRLAKQYGVSIIERPSQRQLDNADAAVFFNAPAKKTVLPEKCVTIAVSPEALVGVTCCSAVSGIKLALKSNNDLNLPEKFPINSLVAAAMEAGTVFPENLSLLDVLITGCETSTDHRL